MYNKTVAQIIAKRCHIFPFVAVFVEVWPCGHFGMNVWPFWAFYVADLLMAVLVCGHFGRGCFGPWPFWTKPIHWTQKKSRMDKFG